MARCRMTSYQCGSVCFARDDEFCLTFIFSQRDSRVGVKMATKNTLYCGATPKRFLDCVIFFEFSI